MDIKYNVSKYKDSKIQEVKDSVSIEEPLEMRLKFKKNGKWETQNISITMRTPGNDEDLIRGFLFNERIIENLNQIETTEQKGDDVGDYNLKNTIEATINNIENLDIERLKRNFLTNSSCGVCGKSSLDALEIIKKEKTDSSEPKITKDIIILSPNILKTNQSEFSKTGGIHASGLFSSNGDLINLKEDVGRHNALDKLIGSAMINDQIEAKNQFITCSGRLNFELVQKVLMTNIGIMVGVGAPTSLAIDLANKFDMTLIGFVKKDSFNVYTNNKKVIVD